MLSLCLLTGGSADLAVEIKPKIETLHDIAKVSTAGIGCRPLPVPKPSLLQGWMPPVTQRPCAAHQRICTSLMRSTCSACPRICGS